MQDPVEQLRHYFASCRDFSESEAQRLGQLAAEGASAAFSKADRRHFAMTAENLALQARCWDTALSAVDRAFPKGLIANAPPGFKWVQDQK